jgi:pimeloyl-ACP methyl ester carboxylesterase
MGRIHLEERGHGPATLFLHGLGSGRIHFAEVADLLLTTHRCLLVDLPGHCDAGPSEGGSPADYAAELVTLVQREAPVNVVGVSFGCLVALELWHMAPDAVANVVLVDPPLAHEPLLDWAREAAGIDSDPMEVLLSVYREREPEKLLELMRHHPLTRDLDEEPLRRNAATTLAADPKAMLGTLRHLASHELPRRRPVGSTAGVTVVRATRGLVCPPDAARDLARALGGATAAVDSGHCVPLDAPRELASMLANVLGESDGHH